MTPVTAPGLDSLLHDTRAIVALELEKLRQIALTRSLTPDESTALARYSRIVESHDRRERDVDRESEVRSLSRAELLERLQAAGALGLGSEDENASQSPRELESDNQDP